MSRWWRTNTCERAAQWISLDLDAELSQLEQAALARHLGRCARCQAVSTEVSSFTRMLREAPLIELERELAYPAPRRARVRAVRRASGSPLSFQSLQQQQRFAAIEVRRLEPVVGAVVETWCVGNCTL